MNQDTFNSVALLIARLVLGVVLFAHGTQKVFGWFGGYGFSATLGYFQNTMGVPAPIAVAGTLAEFVVSLLLILGVSTGLASVIAMLQMAAAIYLSHRHDGFFMNYFGQLPAGREGFEYNIVLIGLLLMLLIAGPGRYSVDSIWNLDIVRKFLGWQGV